jgi:Zn-dependent protease with chaperone function
VTGVILLITYAVAVGWRGPAALRRGWATRIPRLAIGLWLALSASWVTAAALAILGLTAPAQLAWPGPHAAAAVILAARTGSVPMAVHAAGLLLAAALPAWASGSVAWRLASSWRERRHLAGFLAAAARPDPELGAVILSQDSPAAYCLPGRRHRIVISAGTLAVLQPAQLQAVLAHEHAHLRGRHHLLVATASALGRAFPFVPLLAQAGDHVPALAEMAADDHATRRHDHTDLAAALVILATTRARHAELTAGGTAAITRIQRLLAPPRPPGRPARIGRLAAGAAGLTLAATITCLPLVAAACSITGGHA